MTAADVWLFVLSGIIAAAVIGMSIGEAFDLRRRRNATCCVHCTSTTNRLRAAGIPQQRTYRPGGQR